MSLAAGGVGAEKIISSVIQTLRSVPKTQAVVGEAVAEAGKVSTTTQTHEKEETSLVSSRNGKITYDAHTLLGRDFVGLKFLTSHIIRDGLTADNLNKLQLIINGIIDANEIEHEQIDELIGLLQGLNLRPKKGSVDSIDSSDESGTKPKGKEEAEERVEQPEPTEEKLNTDPVGFLADNVKKIIRRELLNKSSWIGLANEIAKQTGMGSIDDIEKFIDETLITEEFKTQLANSIKGKKVNTEGFNKLQSKAFKVASWGIWAIDKMPSWSIQYFPLLTTGIKFSMPIWTHIPKLNKTLGTLYPFIDEIGAFVGKFQIETDNIKKAVDKIKPKPTVILNGGSDDDD